MHYKDKPICYGNFHRRDLRNVLNVTYKLKPFTLLLPPTLIDMKGLLAINNSDERSC